MGIFSGTTAVVGVSGQEPRELETIRVAPSRSDLFERLALQAAEPIAKDNTSRRQSEHSAAPVGGGCGALEVAGINAIGDHAARDRRVHVQLVGDGTDRHLTGGFVDHVDDEVAGEVAFGHAVIGQRLVRPAAQTRERGTDVVKKSV